MFITVLFIINKTCKDPTCPLIEGWRNNLWFIQAMECYSGITKNELLIHAMNY